MSQEYTLDLLLRDSENIILNHSECCSYLFRFAIQAHSAWLFLQKYTVNKAQLTDFLFWNVEKIMLSH